MIAIIVADFNPEITGKMVKIAIQTAKRLDLNVVKIMHVPGSYDIPFAAKKALMDKNVKGVVALGCIIQGETYHDIVIAETAALKLADLSLEFNKPIGMGIIGPRVNEKAAKARAEEYAVRAVEAVKKLLFL